MHANTRATEGLGLVGVIDADAYTAAAYSSGWIEAKDFFAYAALVSAGTLGASATLDAKLEQASDASGTGVKDITGKAITQLTQAGTDSDKQAWIDLHPSELDHANGFNHFRLTMTVGTATSDAAGYVFGYGPKLSPASTYDLASVDEIVT